MDFSKIKKILKKVLIVLGLACLVVMLITFFYMLIVYFEYLGNRDSIFAKINDFSEALNQNTETNITLGIGEIEDKESSYILDRHGKVIAKYSPEKHKLIQLNHIPYFVSNGFLLIEDNRFYNHGGINIVRLGIAVIKNVFTLGKSPGGSTISQQLAKILFTKQKKTIKRKVYELYCTLELERKFTKNEILQIYLNSIYLGHGVYGIANASKFYFGKDANELTIAEAALFIGMNRAPELYSPIKYPKNAMKVQKIVLYQFVKEGYLKKEDVEYEFKRFWKRFMVQGVAGNQSFWKTEINKSGYVTEFIRQILEKELDYEKITQGGLIVETTIDLDRQVTAENVVKYQLRKIREKVAKNAKGNVKNPKEYADKVEASHTSIDYINGEVLVLVGGSGYSFANQLNRAVYAFRPIGSSIKPIIYANALSQKKIGDKEIHPFTKFKDEIKTYMIFGKPYTPKNYHYNHEYGNMVTLFDALKTSLNTVSVAVFNEMDKKKVADYIRDAAFLYTKSEKKRVPEVLSLALGTAELSSLELATAYSVFCRGGKSLYPKMIKKVYDTKGNVFYDYERQNNEILNNLWPVEYRDPKQLIEPEVAYEIVQMMRGVFEQGGTGYYPASKTGLNITAYGKSGTSQDYKDAWFAGFTDYEASATWVGLDDNESIYTAGSVTAGLIWCDYNRRVSSSITNPLQKPKNMKLIKICKDTNLTATNTCPRVREFYFWRDGPIPEECYLHQSDIQDDLIYDFDDEQ